MSLDRMNPEDIARAWNEFSETRAPVLRAQLFEAYLDFANRAARKVIGEGHFRGEMDTEDLTSAGTIGLLEAIDTYQPRDDAKFETYCFTRVRGAVIGEIRAFETSHKLREAAANPDDADARPRASHHRSRSRRSRPQSGPASEPADQSLGRVSVARKFSLDNTRRFSDGDESGGTWKEVLEDLRDGGPTKDLARQEVKDVVTRECSDVERLVLVLYYYEDLTLQQIGTVIKRTEGRVCQIHRSLLGKLRSRLESRREELLAMAS